MPVRSSGSSVLKWPDVAEVDRAVRKWAQEAAHRRDVLRVGYFGSYARRDWGVGSDVDLVLIVRRSERPFWERPLDWDATRLPVPADVFVYTKEEWGRITDRPGFGRTVEGGAIWVLERE